jgi:aspartate-semialdehyde dehydrogenase
MGKVNVAVVGAGAVGVEMLRVLRQRNFPCKSLKVLARTTRDIEVDGQKYEVRQTEVSEFKGVDIALFAGTEGEKGAAVTFAKDATGFGATVIDNGSDFRMKPDVPLVVPEVNVDDLRWHKGIIANPNCSTIQMVVALYPIHVAARIKRIIVSTYQAVSGTGRKAMEELAVQGKWMMDRTDGGNPSVADIRVPDDMIKAYPYRIAFNLIPQISKFEEMDYTTEEWKMVRETHKIMHDDGIAITATTVRVPVFNAHSMAIYVETERAISAEEARQILRKAPGVKVIDEPCPDSPQDDPKRRTYPMPLDADGRDEVFVGRIRRDIYVKNALNIWVVADNIRKGAALNAVQIAEKLLGGTS